ncbi:MAG: hypothetical protein LBP51_06725 [Deferribacteraceae bacterium]|nr:hypothetical protein [Deferribacteraceae bacterium]
MKKLLFIALFLSFGFSAFALTFDAGGGTINAYSSLRLFWQYQNIDIDRDAATAVDYNRGSLPIGAQSNSRLGFTFAKDNYGAQIEFGLNLVDEGSTLRLANFNYGFTGIGKFTVGLQPSLTGTDSFFSQKLNSNVRGGDDGASGIGGLATERHAAITFSLEKNLASIQLIPTALYTNAIDAAGTNAAYSNTSNQQLIPIISLGFDGSKALEVPVRVGLTYANFTGVADNATNPKDEETFDVSAFIVSAVGNPTFGPLTVTLAGFYSYNGNVFGEVKGWDGGSWGSGLNGSVGAITGFQNNGKAGEIRDIRAFGAAAEVKFKASDTITAVLGGGFQQFSYDKHQIADEDIANFGIYANSTIKLGSVFSITPEIDYLSLESTANNTAKGTDKLSAIIVGAQLRLDI